jgi:NAD(P)-dependent dehydrogenase (short-subunit alcohol dehydrogenase family)
VDEQRRFEGKVAVVAGIGPVGRAIAERYGREGAAVVVADFLGDHAEGAADAIRAAGGTAVAVVADVTNETQVAGVMDTASKHFGRLDILYNNTVTESRADGELTEMAWETFSRTMLTNAGGVMLGTKHAVPLMRASGGGVIINTASVSALWGDVERSAYGSSKAAIMTLTKYIATMYGKDRIRCNAIAPSLILSAGIESTLAATGMLGELAAERLLEWPSTAEEIAGIAAWLSSDEARGITGQTIVVDSGTTAHRHRHAFKQWDAGKQVQGATS